jgi:hypothetical protein
MVKFSLKILNFLVDRRKDLVEKTALSGSWKIDIDGIQPIW